ncbi:hypothetical protein EV217_2668 [Phyllobacterium myrsinacearum]|nr:hypothetical protein EV217_2668 [Phyllobacterium myrsinacearum]
MLSAKRHIPRDHSLDVSTSKRDPAQRVDLIFDPHDCRTHRAGRWERSQGSQRDRAVRVRAELQAVDDNLRLIAVGSLPVDGIRAIALLPAWTLPDTGHDVLGKPALQRGRDYGDVTALTPCDGVCKQGRSQRDTYARLQDSEPLAVDGRMPPTNGGGCRKKPAHIGPAHLDQYLRLRSAPISASRSVA